MFNIKNEAFPPIDFESKLSKVKRKVSESMSVYKLHDFIIIFKYSGKSHFFLLCCEKIATLGVNLAFKINCPNEVTRFQAAIVEFI